MCHHSEIRETLHENQVFDSPINWDLWVVNTNNGIARGSSPCVTLFPGLHSLGPRLVFAQPSLMPKELQDISRMEFISGGAGGITVYVMSAIHEMAPELTTVNLSQLCGLDCSKSRLHAWENGMVGCAEYVYVPCLESVGIRLFSQFPLIASRLDFQFYILHQLVYAGVKCYICNGISSCFCSLCKNICVYSLPNLFWNYEI